MSKFEVAPTSLYVPTISIIPHSAKEKIACSSYLFSNFLRRDWWNSGRISQSINLVVNVVIKSYRLFKLIQLHEIVLIAASRTAEFN